MTPGGPTVQRERVVELLARMMRNERRLASNRYVAPEPIEDEALGAVLDELCGLADFRVVPHLIWLLGFDRAQTRKLAANAIAALVTRRADDLLEIDGSIRPGAYYTITGWPPEKPFIHYSVDQHAARRVIADRPPTVVLGILSLTADGRARELATRALAWVNDGEEIPFLLLRAADWVKEVRAVAEAALRQRLRSENAAALVLALPMLERVRERARLAGSDILSTFEMVIASSSEGMAALRRGLEPTAQRDQRRACAAFVFRREEIDADSFRDALADPDVITRTRVAEAILGRASPDELEILVPILLEDASPRIRTWTFRIAKTRCPGVLAPHLDRLVLDANVWLRDFARQSLGPRDFRAIYAEALERGNADVKRIALAGLSEVGTTLDARLVLPHVCSGCSRVRQAALRALARLDPEAAEVHLVAALGDPLRGVSRVALALAENRPRPTLAELTPHFQSPFPHVRCNALSRVKRLDRWEELIRALELATDPASRVSAHASKVIRNWVSRSVNLYSAPTESQRTRLRALLAKDTEAAKVRDLVRFMVKDL
jgi:HEAT repeat protein